MSQLQTVVGLVDSLPAGTSPLDHLILQIRHVDQHLLAAEVPQYGLEQIHPTRFDHITIIIQSDAMAQLQAEVYQWLVGLGALPQMELDSGRISLDELTAKGFFTGNKVGEVVSEMFKRRKEEPPPNLLSLKKNPQPAGQLYNWNLLNESMRRLGIEIDSEMKSAILGGEWEAAESVLNELMKVDSSLSQESKPHNTSGLKENTSSPKQPKLKVKGKSETVDILDYVLQILSSKLKLTKKQAIALIADNNRYLAHVYVKGVKGSFVEIEEILEQFFVDQEMIVSKMVESHDVCDFFLQMIKPSILSKSEDVAMWGCKILSETAHDLMTKELLPLGYQWLIKENGGLSTAILCLSRHPKLRENVVNFILEFGRFNISELLTVELKKFCPDNLSYLKFLLQIFNPVVDSQISSEELLNSGALDYWIEQAEKGADNDGRNTPELRLVSVELLCLIWKAYPIHIEDTLGLANNIMGYFKKGMRDSSDVLRLTLLQQLFELLQHFARLKNPFASIIYKKLTFMFIENHQLSDFREMALRNFQQVFRNFTSIPVDIFLEPFAKQLKISEGKTYILNVSDMEFVLSSIKHGKLKVKTAIELIDFLAKTFLNDPVFWRLAYDSIEILCERFLVEEVFLDYCVKLVKVCLALFMASMKERKGKDDKTRLAMQKRSQIVMLLLMFLRLENESLKEEIKILTVHTKMQIKDQYKYQHDGIMEILEQFGDTTELEKEIINRSRHLEDNNSVLESKNKNKDEGIKLPKINSKEDKINSKEDRISSMSDVSQSRKSNVSSQSQKRQEFPLKDYAEFETEEERAFLQQHGIGLKKKKPGQSLNKIPKDYSSIREQNRDTSLIRDRKEPIPNTAKVMEHIDKIKEKKEEELRKKAKEQELINKKKELLKEKIKKEMEQRTVAVGKGNDRNAEARVFEENEINEKLLVDHEMKLNPVDEQEERDLQSLQIVLKRSQVFLKKVFSRYQNASELKKKEVFDSNGQLTHFLSQLDCIRMFKEKGIEKDKTTIQQLLKLLVKKSELSLGINYETFQKLLEQYSIHTFSKNRAESLGDYVKELLKKLSHGENFRLEEEEDETVKDFNNQVKANPQVEMPPGYKKLVERQYHLNNKVTYQNSQLLPRSYVDCYEILNDIIHDTFSVKIMEPGFEVRDEIRVLKKPVPPPPPKIPKKDSTPLLEEKEKPIEARVGSLARDKSLTKEFKIPSMLRREAKSGDRRLNSVEKKKRENLEQAKIKEDEEEKIRKGRALELKKKLDQQNEERKKEREKKIQDQKEKKMQEEEKARKDKETKEHYAKEQKERVDKYKREQESQVADEKKKKQDEEKKNLQARKQALKVAKKKKDEKQKQEEENTKKVKGQKELEEKQKKQEEQKKRELAKRQAKKKGDLDREKLENKKHLKETLHRLYEESSIQETFNSNKDQLKALYNFGLEFNDVKMGSVADGIQLKGWLAITQSLHMCDPNTATMVFKNLQKDYDSKHVSLDILQENILNFACRESILNQEEFQQLVGDSQPKLVSYLQKLSIPKEKAKHKDFFQKLRSMKRNVSYNKDNKEEKQEKQAKEEQIEAVDPEEMQPAGRMEVTNPDGNKEQWGLKEQ